MPTRARPSRFRLSPDVRPVAYDVHLDPDLDGGRFRGEVRITVRLAKARDAITLHSADLTIDEATVDAGDGVQKARASVQRADETVTVRTPRRMAAGDVTLALRFHGPFNPHLRGLYGARANGRSYAFTQCETADARRIFPCFDEPSFKARFRVAVTVPDGAVALGNSPIERETPAADGRRVVHFAETPPLSSYLFALGLGALEATEPRHLGPVPIRVWYVPGKAHLAAFGLEAAYESLRRLEDYFGIPYPYAKLDLVAVPDFEAGAMENAGAVFFRETLLLLDPETVSLPERKRAAEVIAHELAHMWYGDLVTMAWWDDLWLNEAFATWMAYRVVDDWRPDWRMWNGFEHDRASALALDALANTHPIYATVRSVAEATQNFDVITYEKGAAVVRMLEHYLGPDAFRDGVRLYMQRHREGNTVAADLWRALEEASGTEVTRVAEAWIEQPGFPLLRLEGDDGRTLRLRQERFFADPRVPAPRRRVRWPVPLVVRRLGDGAGAVTRALIDRAAQVVPLPDGAGTQAVFGNAAAGGFYRVQHQGAARTALLDNLVRLTAVERQALVGDQWALVRSARDRIESFLEVADALGDETDHDVLDGLAAPLALVDAQVVTPGGPDQAAFRAWVARRFGPAFAGVGWIPGADEDDAARLRRAALLRIVGLVAETPSVVEEASRRLDEYLADRRALEPNVADAVVTIGARVGDAERYARYRAVVAEARTPQERRRFLLSLSSFRATALVQETLDAILREEIPTQDVAFVLMRLFANPAGRERAWTFVRKRWKALKRRIPPLMLSRLVEATPELREVRHAREVRAFFRANAVPEAARAVKQALEVFRLNAELRKRTAPGLARWLAATTS